MLFVDCPKVTWLRELLFLLGFSLVLLVSLLLFIHVEILAFFPWTYGILKIFASFWWLVGYRFSLRIFNSLIIGFGSLEWVISALHSTSHCCLASCYLCKSLICTLFRIAIFSCSFWLFTCPTLFILLIRCCITLDVPSLIHHLWKIIISINAGRNVWIVLDKLILSDNSIRFSR